MLKIYVAEGAVFMHVASADEAQGVLSEMDPQRALAVAESLRASALEAIELQAQHGRA